MRNPADVLQATFDSFTTKLQAVSDDNTVDFKLPKRRSMQVGAVAYDCEEFVVSISDTYSGTPGFRASGYQTASGGLTLFSVDVQVALIRDVPVGSGPNAIPNTSALNNSALETANDAGIIHQAFFDAMADNSIAGECDFVYFGGVAWVGPEGGLIGAVLTMSVQL